MGPAELRLRIDAALRDVVRLAVVGAAPVRVAPAGEDLDREIEETCRELTRLHAGLAPARIAGLVPARELYRAFGIDPTRLRPSSESLLRRVLRGKPFPRVLNAVDVGNLCSLRFLLPLGLYDADRVRGDVALRRGSPGESYTGIRKDEVHLGARPVLADREGPFGNPTSDSARTAVSPATRSLWMVVFAPRSVAAETLERHAAAARALMERHLGQAGRPPETFGRVVEG